MIETDYLPHLSIDVGGTEVKVVVFSPELNPEKKFSLNSSDVFHQQGEQDIRALYQSVQDRLSSQTDFDRLGISFNCVMHQDRVVFSTLLGGGEGTDLGGVAKDYFDFRRFKADNDVVAMARAENRLGVGRDTN